MRSFLTAYVRGKKRTLKYEFAIAAFGVWVAYVTRIAVSGSPEWIAAQAVPFGTVTTTVWLYIGAAVGLQSWENRQPGDATVVTSQIEDGEPEAPPATPESAARSVV